MTGAKAWDVDELDEICNVAGLSYVFVATGIREVPRPGGGPDGGGSESHLGELNPRPIHYE